MSVPLLDVQHGEFDQRNLLLQLALGLESAGLQLDAWIERYAPPREGDAAPAIPPDDDPLLLLLLGVVSLRMKLRAHLEAAAEGVEAPARPADPVPRRLDEVLR